MVTGVSSKQHVKRQEQMGKQVLKRVQQKQQECNKQSNSSVKVIPFQWQMKILKHFFQAKYMGWRNVKAIPFCI